MVRNAHAHGPFTVASAARPECHAPTGYTVRDYSGKPAANGVAPRDRMRDIILAFWLSQGIARWVPVHGADGRFTGSRWEVRDMVNAPEVWLPLAGQSDAGRADVAEFSHVRAADNDGAWCACNLLPETGAANASRGGADMTDVPPAALAVLAAWPTYWRENVARKASLARLAG